MRICYAFWHSEKTLSMEGGDTYLKLPPIILLSSKYRQEKLTPYEDERLWGRNLLTEG